MQFSRHTLRSTFKQFNEALKSKGLSLPLGKTHDLWAQIVVGRNYSEVMACADAQGFVNAIPITEDTIRAQLKRLSRDIDFKSAHELFVEAVRDDLQKLSPCMYELVEILKADGKSCLICVLGDRSGLGIIDAKNAGYLPVSELNLENGSEPEFSWMRSSSTLVADVVNAVAGVNGEQSLNIYATNHCAGSKKADDKFANYFRQNVTSFSEKLANEILTSFDLSSPDEWDGIDFDTVRDIVFDVVDRDAYSGERDRRFW